MELVDPEKSCLFNCELFGKHAAFFESALVPLWQGMYDSLVSRAHITEGSSVLDIGTGTGEVALRLSGLVGPSGQVKAIDAQNEMLRIARSKAGSKGLRNIEFKEMAMEAMDLPDNSFDSVVGNYSLCCCMDYQATLSECLRVLKPGGRLTYNHGGPHDPLAFQVMLKIFEGFKTGTPSKRLREMRESEAAQAEAVERYMEPFVTLDVIRGLGFKEAEATVARYTTRYKDVGSYVDEWLLFDWTLETEEIPPEDVERFRKEAIEALKPLSNGTGFSVERDTVFFTGLKG